MPDVGLRYASGDVIRIGDRIRLDGRQGRVVFVLGSGAFPDEWGADDWFVAEYGAGFMLDVEGTGHVFHESADEDLELVGRASYAATWHAGDAVRSV